MHCQKSFSLSVFYNFGSCILLLIFLFNLLFLTGCNKEKNVTEPLTLNANPDVEYQLDIKIDQEDLQDIYSAQLYLIIAKEVVSSGGYQYYVSWVRTVPRETMNIRWKNSYYIYSSRTQAKPGSVIEQISRTSAEYQHWYPCQSNFVFGDPVFDDNLSTNQYGIQNNSAQTLNFGLAQIVNINNSSGGIYPINVVELYHTESAEFTPTEKLFVGLGNPPSWPTYGPMVLSSIDGYSEIEFNAYTAIQSYTYDSDTNKFVSDNP